MSLLKNFPEIENFFKKNRFSKESLDNLLRKLKETYSDHSVFNTAKSLVDLELLKFELLKQTSNDSKIKDKWDEKISQISRKIEDLSNILKVRSDYILSLLKQKNIIKNQEDFLTETEFNKLKPFIKSRLNAIVKIQGRQNKFKKFKNFKNYGIKGNRLSAGESPSKSIYVYDKIPEYGLGKVIYIRSK